MAKTFLDQLVEYPAQVVSRIAGDKYCVGLILNKGFDTITEDDNDKVLDERIFDYQYVDETTNESTAYVWVEMEVNAVDNRQIKGVRLYVTVACHKSYMKLNGTIYKGVIGNRRDNLVRYIDRLLNDSDFMGIGRLSLKSVKTLSTINGFAVRELTFSTPDFNVVDINE